MKKRTMLFTLVLLSGLIFGYSTSFAYSIWHNGGFSPKPTTITCYSGFESATKTAVSNACAQWNSAGKGTLITKSSTENSNPTFPLQNSRNDITKHAFSANNNQYLMLTADTQTSCPFPFTKTYITEADVDINTNYTLTNLTPCPSTSYDVGNGITHEIGHVLGLSHSTISSATMEPSLYLGDISKRTIEQDDKDGISAIY